MIILVFANMKQVDVSLNRINKNWKGDSIFADAFLIISFNSVMKNMAYWTALPSLGRGKVFF